MNNNDGGPAFPCPVGHIECKHPVGMSLRAHFAGQAMQAIVFRLSSDECEDMFESGDAMRASISENATLLADALIERLKQP
jgi:hypothetical protein